MELDYITTATKDWAFSVFHDMPEQELAKELRFLKDSIQKCLCVDSGLVDSFVFEYLDTVFDVAKDALVIRFIHETLSPGCIENES